MERMERFWAKVDKDGPVPASAPDLGQCWLWTATKTDKGYGSFWTGEGMLPAHRVAYEAANGPLADGLETHHLCEVRLCVRPTHLRPLARSEHNAEHPRRNSVLRSFAAVNAAKTHCPRGHLYDLFNTYFYPRPHGGRCCRECRAAQVRERRALGKRKSRAKAR